MGLGYKVEGSIEEFEDDFDRYLKRIKSCGDKLVKVSAKRIEPELKRTFKDSFESAVNSFYEDYIPEYYHRNRSLYNIFEADSLISEDSVSILLSLDDSNMTHDRRGNSLYDTVFVEGWHGGAKSGDVTHMGGKTYSTPHPKPGVPFWRTPYPYYSRWGKQAVRSKDSPYNMYNRNVDKEEARLNKLWGDIVAEEFKKMEEDFW